MGSSEALNDLCDGWSHPLKWILDAILNGLVGHLMPVEATPKNS
jgi:hypothetical protein